MALTLADVDAAIAAVQQRSVAAYLRRQQIEQARITVQQQTIACDQDLLRLDGELAALTALKGTAE